MSVRVFIHRTRDGYAFQAELDELKALSAKAKREKVAQYEKDLESARRTLRERARGPRRTGYQEEIAELEQKLKALRSTDGDYSDWKQAQEYEGRLFFGSYSWSRIEGGRSAPDSFFAKAIPLARERYNALRVKFGLQPVTNWKERPAQLVQRVPAPTRDARTWSVEYDENGTTKNESFQTEALARSFITTLRKDPTVTDIKLYTPDGRLKS